LLYSRIRDGFTPDFLHAAIGMVAVLSCAPAVAQAEDSDRKPCVEDAMLVFDASGSMAGNVNQGIATITPRIDAVRSALAKILPGVTRLRRVGLITYGPGPLSAVQRAAQSQADT
jgi:Ca-activated chloride channel family protein